jgi:hypothetical protein
LSNVGRCASGNESLNKERIDLPRLECLHRMLLS